MTTKWGTGTPMHTASRAHATHTRTYTKPLRQHHRQQLTSASLLHSHKDNPNMTACKRKANGTPIDIVASASSCVILAVRMRRRGSDGKKGLVALCQVLKAQCGNDNQVFTITCDRGYVNAVKAAPRALLPAQCSREMFCWCCQIRRH